MPLWSSDRTTLTVFIERHFAIEGTTTSDTSVVDCGEELTQQRLIAEAVETLPSTWKSVVPEASMVTLLELTKALQECHVTKLD